MTLTDSLSDEEISEQRKKKCGIEKLITETLALEFESSLIEIFDLQKRHSELTKRLESKQSILQTIASKVHHQRQLYASKNAQLRAQIIDLEQSTLYSSP